MALLDIDYLILNIINQTNDQHYSMEIGKLTGELQIFVINNIEVKFKQMQIDSAEIIDSKNVKTKNNVFFLKKYFIFPDFII
jgi:hypothetical protein